MSTEDTDSQTDKHTVLVAIFHVVLVWVSSAVGLF